MLSFGWELFKFRECAILSENNFCQQNIKRYFTMLYTKLTKSPAAMPCIEIPAQSLFNMSWTVTSNSTTLAFKYASVTQSKLSCIMKKYNQFWIKICKAKLMKHLQQKLIVVCKSFNQSVYFVLIAFVFYLIARKTSPILMFSTRKKKLSYMSYFLVWKNPSVCLSVSL